MKSYLALALVFGTSIARAEVTCVINGENPKESGTYDQLLFQGELTAVKPVAIKADRSVISGEELQAEMVKLLTAVPGKDGAVTLQPNETLKDAIMVVADPQEEKSFTIGIGHFELGKPENLLVTDILANGSLSSPLLLVDQAKHLAISCAEIPKAEADAK